MALAFPPKKDNDRFDDWIFLLWKSLTGATTSLTGIALTPLTPATSQGVSAGYSGIAVRSYLIPSGKALVIGLGARFRIL